MSSGVSINGIIFYQYKPTDQKSLVIQSVLNLEYSIGKNRDFKALTILFLRIYSVDIMSYMT